MDCAALVFLIISFAFTVLHFFFKVHNLEWQLEAVTHARDHAERGWSRAARQLRLLEWLQKMGPFQQVEELEKEGDAEMVNSA